MGMHGQVLMWNSLHTFASFTSADISPELKPGKSWICVQIVGNGRDVRYR